MLKPWLPTSAVFKNVLFAWLLSLSVAGFASAAEGGFSATLSNEQKTSAGLLLLTAAEISALDQMIAREVIQIRRDSDSELPGTFVARRTDEEQNLAGLDRLNAEQLSALDASVATVLSTGPKPKERPRIKDTDVFSAKRKPEVHGELSLTYGRSSGGGEFRAASMWVDYFDPNTGLGLGIGISRASGNGFCGFYPDYYDYGSPYSYRRGFRRFGSPFRSFGPSDYYDGQGSSFISSVDWGNQYYRDFREPWRR